MISQGDFCGLLKRLSDKSVKLIAVSKKQDISKIKQFYSWGQRDFGENQVQEMTDKSEQLPNDIRWHMIGRLQKNKINKCIPISYMIHSIDSIKLMEAIDARAKKIDKIQNVLLQIKIASEDTKTGFDWEELRAYLIEKKHLSLQNVNICGLMGMSSNSSKQVRNQEFAELKQYYDFLKAEVFNNDTSFNRCSMGMTDDYKIAISKGSNTVRLGSLLFGSRIY